MYAELFHYSQQVVSNEENASQFPQRSTVDSLMNVDGLELCCLRPCEYLTN
jgi:hypothetical protein